MTFNIFSWQWMTNFKTLPNGLAQTRFHWISEKQSTVFLTSHQKGTAYNCVLHFTVSTKLKGSQRLSALKLSLTKICLEEPILIQSKPKLLWILVYYLKQDSTETKNILNNLVFSYIHSYVIAAHKSSRKWVLIKGAFSGLRWFLATESPLKVIKNTFYFTSKALFVLKIFEFLYLLFRCVAKWLD